MATHFLSPWRRVESGHHGIPRDVLARRVSLTLAAVASLTSALGFFFWGLFHRDVPMGIGNMRGTALTILIGGVPLLVAAVLSAQRGSLRAQFLWLGTLGYLAYNAVMFCFATHFNSLFLLFTTLLALSFWALVTLLRCVDEEHIVDSTTAVPVRSIALYLMVSATLFALLWLQAIVPATLTNTVPVGLAEMGVTQNPVWVLDFAFTFPLMVLGSIWLWRRRAWGLVLGGMMTIMLTLETAGIAVDQVFGHLHDPNASLGAVPVMIGATVVGALFSWLFLRGVRVPPLRADPARSRP